MRARPETTTLDTCQLRPPASSVDVVRSGTARESVEIRGSLLDYLAENSRSVQLVVVGARDNADVEELVGPPGNAVLHKSDCSVLIVDSQHL